MLLEPVQIILLLPTPAVIIAEVKDSVTSLSAQKSIAKVRISFLHLMPG